jgi:hypothetical protein
MKPQCQQATAIDTARQHGLAMLLGRLRGDDLLLYRTAARLQGLTQPAKGHAA